MLLQKIREVKYWAGENKSDLFIAASFFLIAIIGFGLGRLSYVIQNKPPITVGEVQLGAVVSGQDIVEAKYVASKNGTAYYLPECSGVSRIKEENRMWFSSREEAKGLGLRPAQNCPGL